MATWAEVKSRVEMLFRDQGLHVLTGAEGDGEAFPLPAVEVFLRDGEDVPLTVNGGVMRSTRVIEAWLIVARVANDKAQPEQQAALTVAEDYATTVPAYFAARPTLARASGTLAGFAGFAGPMASETGPAIAPYKGRTYAMMSLKLPVVQHV